MTNGFASFSVVHGILSDRLALLSDSSGFVFYLQYCYMYWWSCIIPEKVGQSNDAKIRKLSLDHCDLLAMAKSINFVSSPLFNA